MAVFHVFIEGAADSTAGGTERLAQAIAERYGLPAASLRDKIASGRFRVKGNCDRATAESYASDLTRLGATCSIEQASQQNQSLTPLPFPAPSVAAPTKPPASLSISGLAAAPPATRPSAPAANYQSGLSAAFGATAPDAQLGALGGDAAFTLAAIDGSEDAPPPPSHAFAPAQPPEASSSFGPPSDHHPELEPDPDSPDDQSGGDGGPAVDLFAPPEASEAALSVDLAPEEEERAARRRTNPAIEAVAPPEPPEAAERYAPPVLIAPSDPVPQRPGHPLANERIRFALGVVIALLIGFLPAHLVAAMREKSAFADIDANVVAVQAQADSAASYAALDQFRAAQLERKHDDRQGIALMALFMWGAAGGAIAYVWFRRIRWDRFAQPS